MTFPGCIKPAAFSHFCRVDALLRTFGVANAQNRQKSVGFMHPGNDIFGELSRQK